MSRMSRRRADARSASAASRSAAPIAARLPRWPPNLHRLGQHREEVEPRRRTRVGPRRPRPGVEGPVFRAHLNGRVGIRPCRRGRRLRGLCPGLRGLQAGRPGNDRGEGLLECDRPTSRLPSAGVRRLWWVADRKCYCNKENTEHMDTGPGTSIGSQNVNVRRIPEQKALDEPFDCAYRIYTVDMESTCES